MKTKNIHLFIVINLLLISCDCLRLIFDGLAQVVQCMRCMDII